MPTILNKSKSFIKNPEIFFPEESHINLYNTKKETMTRCPNCSYVLVVLGDSQRCKCAKCGRLFSRKVAESREFRTWNGKQREVDLHNLKIKKPKLTLGISQKVGVSKPREMQE